MKMVGKIALYLGAVIVTLFIVGIWQDARDLKKSDAAEDAAWEAIHDPTTTQLLERRIQNVDRRERWW